MNPLPSLSNPFLISSDFRPATSPQEADGTVDKMWWFICRGSELLVGENTDGVLLPQETSPTASSLVPVRTQFLGYLKERPCVAAEIDETAELPKGMRWVSLRSLYGLLREDLFAIAARAVQLIEWDRNHQFCGHCGTPTTQRPQDRVKRCPKCHFRQYPQLSPAVIMLVYKEDRLLLARAPRFRTGMYSVLAGFVEPGESLEETVAREVKEEVGIEVKNIRYFGSQPWPFPKSLMIGFVAEYASGTITPDLAEIEAADWFEKESLPPVPGELSIARKLIDWFVG